MQIFDPIPYPENLAIVLYAGVVLYTLLFGSTLLSQWYGGVLRKLVDVRLAWSVFNFGMAGNSLFFIVSDFYAVGTDRVLWIKSGYLAMMIALLAFFFALERILPYRTRNIFTVSGFMVAAITVFWPGDTLWVMALAGSLIALAMLLLFFAYFIRSTTGEVRSSIRLILIGFLIAFVGFVGRSEIIMSLLGADAYMLGACLLMVGLLIMGLGVLGSPALDELDWANQLSELYVIQSSGILLFHHEFSRAVDMDQHLAAAGIAGVQALLQEITQSSTGFSDMSVGGYHILFAQGEGFISVLIAKKPYRVLLDMVNDFTSKFQLVYAEQVKRFSGEESQFAGAEGIVKVVFSS